MSESAVEELKPVAKMSRRALEAEAKTIEHVELSRPVKRLELSGLRSAVRLNRRRRGIKPE